MLDAIAVAGDIGSIIFIEVPPVAWASYVIGGFASQGSLALTSELSHQGLASSHDLDVSFMTWLTGWVPGPQAVGISGFQLGRDMWQGSK